MVLRGAPDPVEGGLRPHGIGAVEGGDARRHAAASLEATEASLRFEDTGQRPAQGDRGRPGCGGPSW